MPIVLGRDAIAQQHNDSLHNLESYFASLTKPGLQNNLIFLVLAQRDRE